MTPFEAISLWSSIFILALSFVGQLSGAVFQKERLFPLSIRATLIGFALLTGAVATRWVATGHMPVMGAYENSLFGAWFVMAALLAAVRYFPKGPYLSLIIIPAVLLILGNGIMAKAELAPLEPPYQSSWLYVHILFAWFAFGSYVVASASAGLYLAKKRAEEKGIKGRMQDLLPGLPKLDEICLKFIIFGFITDAVMIGAGAIWARGLWGRYWGWDPVETWSLITWLTYGVNLHLRLTLGWKGRKAAWVALFSLAGMLVTVFGIGLIGEVHTQIMKR